MFRIIKDERLLSKMKGKTNFSRRLKQFDGLTWLTLTPIFYDRSTPLKTPKKLGKPVSEYQTIPGLLQQEMLEISGITAAAPAFRDCLIFRFF